MRQNFRVRDVVVAITWVALAHVLPWPVAAQTADVATPPRSVALELAEAQVQSAFHDVNHMTPDALAALLSNAPDHVVLLDVRTAEEYAISHLPDAVQVAPDQRSANEVARLAGGLNGKIVVAYCSIGLRSSRVLLRIGQAMKEQGATNLYNLKGGIFRWRNERRPLVAQGGRTQAIHPYNVLWRQFLIEPANSVIAAAD
jgi:rhodanese-related sulfurtransferase